MAILAEGMTPTFIFLGENCHRLPRYHHRLIHALYSLPARSSSRTLTAPVLEQGLCRFY